MSNEAAYWRLPIYTGYTKPHMLAVLKTRRETFPSARNKAYILAALSHSDRGLLKYEKCSQDELKTFIRQRRIERPSTLHRTKLLEVLNNADTQLRFTRFLDLPPELRNMVYEFYLKSFRHHRTRSQDGAPPLTCVSRQLRVEAIPMFYDLCPLDFHFSFFRGSGSERVLGPYSRHRGHIDSEAESSGLMKARNFRVIVRNHSISSEADQFECALDLVYSNRKPNCEVHATFSRPGELTPERKAVLKADLAADLATTFRTFSRDLQIGLPFDQWIEAFRRNLLVFCQKMLDA